MKFFNNFDTIADPECKSLVENNGARNIKSVSEIFGHGCHLVDEKVKCMYCGSSGTFKQFSDKFECIQWKTKMSYENSLDEVNWASTARECIRLVRKIKDWCCNFDKTRLKQTYLTCHGGFQNVEVMYLG